MNPTLTIIQRAKFALLYSKQPVVAHDRNGDYVEHHSVESGLNHPAVLELHGLRLTSAVPSSAAEAAKINEKVDAIYEMTLSPMNQ